MNRPAHPVKRRDFIALCAIGGAGAMAFGVGANTPPALGACRIVVGFPPGGSTDVIARRVADRLRGSYATAVVVENRPGAGGRVALEHVKTSATDGTAAVLTPHPMLTVYPHVYSALPYDPLRDFMPVTSVCFSGAALSVGPAVPAGVRNLADFVAWCREHPDQAAYGSAGEGTTPHLMGQLFGRVAGIRFVHVPFLGGAPVVVSVIGGQIPCGMNAIAEVITHHRAGTLRIVAVTGETRSRFLPDVPTLREAGFQDVATPVEWFGMFVPAGTPEAVAERLNAAVRGAVRDIDVAGGFDELALDAAGESVDRFSRRVSADHAQWRRIVQVTGFKVS